MRRRYLIERIGDEEGVRVTVHPTPDACPVCTGVMSVDERVASDWCCLTDPDHTPKGWLPVPYLMPELETGKGHGFEYGYGGTGPAVLAASLVADLFAERPDRELFRAGACRSFIHMESVKWSFVAPLDQHARQHWLDGDEVIAFCRAHEATCEVCQGTGEDPEPWCSVCGAPQGHPCNQDDGEGNPTPHDYTPARCYACLGLKVQRADPVAT